MSDTGDLDGPDRVAYRDLIEIAGRLRDAVDHQLRESGGLSYLQFRMLARLAESPGGSARMTELADGVVHSRSGLTYQAGLLDADGLVTRSPSPGDDRGVTVTITDAGRDLLALTLPGHDAIVRRMLLEPLSDHETAGLAATLDRVRAHITSTAPRRLRRRVSPTAEHDTP